MKKLCEERERSFALVWIGLRGAWPSLPRSPAVPAVSGVAVSLPLYFRLKQQSNDGLSVSRSFGIGIKKMIKRR